MPSWLDAGPRVPKVTCSGPGTGTPSAAPGRQPLPPPGSMGSAFMTFVTRSPRGLSSAAGRKEVQEALGHQTITMTMRYSPLAPDPLRAAVAVLDDVLPASKPS